MVEKERGSSELYEGKVVLQVAPGVVLLQVRAPGEEGSKVTPKGGKQKRRWDRILIQGP